MDKLTDEKVLALEKILVRDNKKVVKINGELGTMGCGNTNTSSYAIEGESIFTLDYIDGKSINLFDPFERYKCWCDQKVGIAAVVEDVVYLIIEKCYSGEREVRTIELGSHYSMRAEVAYDTFGLYSLTPEEKDN